MITKLKFPNNLLFPSSFTQRSTKIDDFFDGRISSSKINKIGSTDIKLIDITENILKESQLISSPTQDYASLMYFIDRRISIWVTSAFQAKVMNVNNEFVKIGINNFYSLLS